jgi:LmbE family N-acetylglucosaminyl deacetylase
MRILIAVAHADDETLGCSTLLTRDRSSVDILHATGSAPRDLRFAWRAGFATRPAYAAARRAELLAMLAKAGIPESRYHCLDIADQEAPQNWRAIRQFVESFPADRVYTHAYEGGHPDHDAIAFALQGLLHLWEFPLYHGRNGGFHPGAFLKGEPEIVEVLDGGARRRKQELLDCFASQRRVIEQFPLDREVFRQAAMYDFNQPPHEGELYYEFRKLGWTWPEWRAAISFK